MVICVVLAPYTVRRADGSTAAAGGRVVLTDTEAQRLAGQQVVRVLEPIGGH